MEGYSQDGEFSQSQDQAWSQNAPWMSFSQPQIQPISPQLHASSFDRFGGNSSKFFSPFGLPGMSGSRLRQSVGSSAEIFSPPLGRQFYSGSDLQLSEEAVEKFRNPLMDVKEEEEIREAAKALNGEVEPTPKKRGRPAKGGKSSAPPPSKKKTTKLTKKKNVEVVELDGSSDEEEELTRKWRDYEVETLIAIRGEMEEEFSRCAKKQGMCTKFFSNFCVLYICMSIKF